MRKVGIKKFIIYYILALVLASSISTAQPMVPFSVGGRVTINDISAGGIEVEVQNLNTGEVYEVLTEYETPYTMCGFYTVAFTGENGQVVAVKVTYDGKDYYNSTVVDVQEVTQLCDIAIFSSKPPPSPPPSPPEEPPEEPPEQPPEEPQEPQELLYNLTVFVSDEITNTSLVNASVTIYDLQFEMIAQNNTNISGLASFQLEEGTYIVQVEGDEYKTRRKRVNLNAPTSFPLTMTMDTVSAGNGYNIIGSDEFQDDGDQPTVLYVGVGVICAIAFVILLFLFWKRGPIHRKPFFLFLIFILFIFSQSLASAQLNPIAVAGYITYSSGTPVPDGTYVTVYDRNSGNYANTTTALGTGMYASVVMGSNGDVINVNSTYGSRVGNNTVTADLIIPTQWCNVTLADTRSSPIADFTYIPSSPSVGETVLFTDRSSDSDGVIVSWRWNFGEGGTTSPARNPRHMYNTIGSYTVTLTVVDDDNLESTARKTIRIGDESIYIPPPQPPLYYGFTVPEMYDLLRVSSLSDSDNKITVVFVDTGTYPRSYNEIDLTTIKSHYHPVYPSGLDTNGHGGFVAYELAYILQTKVPNAELMSYRAFDQYGRCSSEVFLESLDAVKEFRPDIVSISGGGRGTPDDALSKKIQELRDSGIIVISVSAGNRGPIPATILSPACSDSAIAVGASNPQWADDYEERRRIILDLSDDILCPWSSRGPVEGVAPKPDICAPGESIIGPWMGQVEVVSGSSFSAPLIAGGASVVLANNKLLVDIVRILYFWNGGIIANSFEDSLKEGCYTKGNANDWGMGIPVFTDVNGIFFWKLIVLILIPIIIICAIVTTYVLLQRKKDKKQKRITLL